MADKSVTGSMSLNATAPAFAPAGMSRGPPRSQLASQSARQPVGNRALDTSSTKLAATSTNTSPEDSNRIEPGVVVWLLERVPGSQPVVRKNIELDKTDYLETTGYGHPLIVTKLLPFYRGWSEEQKYEGVLVTTAQGMTPSTWYSERKIRRDLKKSLPLDHPQFGRIWEPVTLGAGQRECQALLLTPESRPMNSKPSFAKCEATLQMTRSQVRLYHKDLPIKGQPRLDFNSFASLMSLVCPAENSRALYFAQDNPIQEAQDNRDSLDPY